MKSIESEMAESGEYAGTAEAMQAAIAQAEADGLIIVYGTPNTLLLDLDDDAEINQDVIERLWQQFGETEETSWPSRGGNGRHVVLRFMQLKREFTPAEALALEGALGSDPKRVLFGIARLKLGVEQPRMLWRPPTPEEQAAKKAVETLPDLPF